MTVTGKFRLPVGRLRVTSFDVVVGQNVEQTKCRTDKMPNRQNVDNLKKKIVNKKNLLRFSVATLFRS